MIRPSPRHAPPPPSSHLRSGPAADAFKLGQDAIELLDRHAHKVPLDLLRKTAEAAFISGDGQAGETLLDQAMQHVEAGDEEGTGPLDQARVIGEQARRLIIRGDLEQAEQLLPPRPAAVHRRRL